MFIIKCCQKNIFFAHKAWFNLKASLINKDNEVQVNKILKLISEIEVSLFSNNLYQEKLFIACSENLINLIVKTNLT